MELEKLCCSIEKSKRLSELGIDTTSATFSHFQIFSKKDGKLIDTQLALYGNFDSRKHTVTLFPAFTVGELGEVICSNKSAYEKLFFKIDKKAKSVTYLISKAYSPDYCHYRGLKPSPLGDCF